MSRSKALQMDFTLGLKIGPNFQVWFGKLEGVFSWVGYDEMTK